MTSLPTSFLDMLDNAVTSWPDLVSKSYVDRYTRSMLSYNGISGDRVFFSGAAVRMSTELAKSNCLD